MRYYIECLNKFQGGAPQWERVALGDGHDEGFSSLEAARLVGARLLSHPMIAGYRIHDAESEGAMVETHQP